MQNRVPTKPNRALIRPEDGGSAFYATITRADEPTQPGDPLNKNTFLKDETAALFGFDGNATPNDVFRWLGEWGQANWKLLAEYNTGGAYTFTVPDDVDELGLFILGGGGGGAAKVVGIGDTASAAGGGSGGLKQIVLKKGEDFLSGENIPVVVGAGGQGGVSTKNNTSTSTNSSSAGGTSAFKSIVGEYGQTPDGESTLAPYGLDGIRENGFGYGGRNIFDPNDTHIYCGAGGYASYRTGPYQSDGSYTTTRNAQQVVSRAGGSAGAGSYSTGGSATAPGDGGGGAALSTGNTNATVTGGNGADGLVLVYGRKVV